jgi:hypothetical protein
MLRISCLVLAAFTAINLHAQVAAIPGEKTDNPQKYVLAHSEIPDKGLTQFDCKKCSSMTDLLFVAATSECGNAACDYFAFRKKGSEYEYITTLSTQANGFQFLKTKHHGMSDILDYHHMSAGQGLLSTLKFDGKNYMSADKGRTISSSEFEKFVKPEPVERIYFSKDLKKIDQK